MDGIDMRDESANVDGSATAIRDPLREPVRTSTPSQDAPWRDNAWLAFWDPSADVIGVAHVSTSPNAGARHARISVSHDGRLTEVIEPLEAGSFASEHIHFDLDEGISLDVPDVSGTLK